MAEDKEKIEELEKQIEQLKRKIKAIEEFLRTHSRESIESLDKKPRTSFHPVS